MVSPFPTWKGALPATEYEEMSERLEDIEHRMFGTDDAVKRIAGVGSTLGFADLGQFTAQPPPRA
jgi:hypothetical protein